jgi:prepilin-type N-terminal cleavage/methylation domain-containing protein
MFRNGKKGFTFVELAIVLVIIGIIMGMALKGRSLIEGAKTRSEVRKLEKIQASVSGWYTNTGIASTPTEFWRLNETYGCGSAEEGTVASTLITNADVLCLDLRQLPEIRPSDRLNPFNDNWTMFGGAWVDANATLARGANFTLVSSSSHKFACNVERLMNDDGYFFFGDVRSLYDELRINTPAASPLTARATDDPALQTCDEWPTDFDDQGYVGYQMGL